MPSWPPSRPMPLCFDAAERGRRVADQAAVEADHAGLERLADPQAAGQVAGVDVGDQAVLGVVGQPDRLVLVGERDDRGDRAEDLLAAGSRAPARHVDQHGRLVVEARAGRAACRRSATRAPAATAPATSSSTLPTASSLTSGPTWVSSSVPGPTTQRGHPLGEPAGELVGDRRLRRRTGWPRCRPRRRCASSRSSRRRRRRRGRRRRRRGTARCRRAPSSVLTTWSAASRSSTRPTSVEPVNDSLRTRGSCSIAETTAPDRRAGSTLTTPAGTPASSRIAGHRQRGQRGVAGRLEDHRAAGGQRRADLAGRHRGREVPRRDEHADADRLLQHHDLVRTRRRGRRPCPDAAHRLLGVPAEELGGVGHLAACVGERLAVLQRDQLGELVGPRRSSARTPGAGSRPAPAARSRPSRRPRRRPRRPRRARPRRVAVGDATRCTSPVAGSSTSKRPPSDAGTALPPMQRSSVRSEIWSSASQPWECPSGAQYGLATTRSCAGKSVRMLRAVLGDDDLLLDPRRGEAVAGRAVGLQREDHAGLELDRLASCC